MRDSLTYQAVLEDGRAEGRAEEARRLLRQLGERRFGPPDAATAAVIDGLTELEQIERATLRLLDAASWDDALAGPIDR